MAVCISCGVDPCVNPSFCDACRRDAERHRSRRANGAGTQDGASDDSARFSAEISRLAGLSVVQYERERAEAAKRLGIRTHILDRLIAAEHKPDDAKQGRALQLPEPQAWHKTVSGAILLDELSAAIRRHVVMPDHATDTAALWVVHTYLLDVFGITPRLAVTSPEKGCGKTTLLDVLSHLVWRPLPSANATASAIFRVVEMKRPTLLIDEGDTFLTENENLRGILNSGHRRGGFVLRAVGDDFDPRAFSTYSACAIALIGKLPATLADRSVPIGLRRRRADEAIEPFRLDRPEHLDQLARMAARWAADNAEGIRTAEPDMPSSLFNRAADNWRPLFVVADAAGGQWPERARRAAQAAMTADDETARELLFADIRSIFAERAADRLASVELVEALVAIEGRPWAEWKSGKPITANGLARLLAPFRIAPATIRTGDRTAKGYQFAQFEDAFARYSRPEPSQCNKADEMGTSASFQNVTPALDVTVSKSKKLNNGGQSYDVTVQKARSENFDATRRCNHCGGIETPADPLKPWNWAGRPDGILLHQRCEEPWDDRSAQGVTMDEF